MHEKTNAIEMFDFFKQSGLVLYSHWVTSLNTREFWWNSHKLGQNDIKISDNLGTSAFSPINK